MRRHVPDRGLLLAGARVVVMGEVQAQAGAHRWHGGARDPAGIAHPELRRTGGSQRPSGEGAGPVIEHQRARKRRGGHRGHHAAQGEGHQQFGQQRAAPATARGALDVVSDAGRGGAGTGSRAQGKRHGPTVALEPHESVTAASRPWSWHRAVRRHPLAAAPRGPGGDNDEGGPTTVGPPHIAPAAWSAGWPDHGDGTSSVPDYLQLAPPGAPSAIPVGVLVPMPITHTAPMAWAWVAWACHPVAVAWVTEMATPAEPSGAVNPT